jgi:hypothetical protein
VVEGIREFAESSASFSIAIPQPKQALPVA